MQPTQQAALIELGLSALMDTDLPTLMRQAVELVARTLEVEYSKILELLADGSTLVLREGVGWKEGTVGQATIEQADALPSSVALLSATPLIITDWRREARCSQPSLLSEHGVLSSLSVIISEQGNPVGVLGADSTRPGAFTDDDCLFLKAVANVLGIAIERSHTLASLLVTEQRFLQLAEHAADVIYHYRLAPEAGFDYISPATLQMTGFAPSDYYAEPGLALRLVHPEDRPLLQSAIVSHAYGDAPLMVRLIRKDGTVIWTEQRIVPFHDTEGQPVGAVGIVRDITERVRTQQLLEQRIEQRTRELERRHEVAQGVHDVLAILNSNRTPDEILNYIIVQACRLLETPIGAIYRLNRNEGLLKIRASRGLNLDDAALTLPAEWGALAQAVATRQPVAIADTTAVPLHERYWPQALPNDPVVQPVYLHRALLVVPLIVKDDVYGAIALFYQESRAFTEEELRLVAMLSDQAALAIENARLISAAQGKAILDERQRLARDLHDSVTQALYGMMLYAEAAARLLPLGELETVKGLLRDLHDTAQEALQEMRLLIFELRPPILDGEGLVAALRARLEGVEGRSDLETNLSVDLERRLSAPIEQSLYRVAQETLNNVVKHAHAQHVTVSVSQVGATVLLEITDDGVGFDLKKAQEKGGLGLRGLAERVSSLGGRLSLQSEPGIGTRVRVEVEV